MQRLNRYIKPALSQKRQIWYMRQLIFLILHSNKWKLSSLYIIIMLALRYTYSKRFCRVNNGRFLVATIYILCVFCAERSHKFFSFHTQ